MRDGRPVTVEVTSDGAGLVSHAGTALVAQVADTVGLTNALSLRLGAIKQRRRGHDPGRVIRDLAVMLVDGGECVADLGAVREQETLFGAVASDSTAFRMVDRIASTPGLLDAVRVAHARARARFWELHGAPGRLTLDVDATLITAHSEKEKAAGNYKGGYGFHPLQVYLDETREALGELYNSNQAGTRDALDEWDKFTTPVVANGEVFVAGTSQLTVYGPPAVSATNVPGHGALSIRLASGHNRASSTLVGYGDGARQSCFCGRSHGRAPRKVDHREPLGERRCSGPRVRRGCRRPGHPRTEGVERKPRERPGGQTCHAVSYAPTRLPTEGRSDGTLSRRSGRSPVPDRRRFAAGDRSQSSSAARG